MLAVILFQAKAGCSWWTLPAHLFGTTRATAHRRFSEWTAAGLWERLHQAVLDQVRWHGGLDLERAIVDSVQVRPDPLPSTLSGAWVESCRPGCVLADR
ncbi:hypothetical protein GCM10022220_48500 [Actinocatenispora rupis]|uniref:Insertion element IS402-like domain-containing protein n=1 Tax=Actinocatenispora rupis TaxID=519421 RepID=A0A8J3J920_9ACTN|nr:hypothetical protein Aru02nite_32610 [Actinocatenispora rupis]